MNKSKASLLIALIFLITSCAESEPPVEVFYDDVTNEQMFINIKNNDLDEVKRFVEINRKYLNICLLYTSPSPRDSLSSRMPSSA